ncbi:hypothetical protein SAMN05660649_05186, partial [Desulfotomaculum arcticum]
RSQESGVRSQNENGFTSGIYYASRVLFGKVRIAWSTLKRTVSVYVAIDLVNRR